MAKQVVKIELEGVTEFKRVLRRLGNAVDDDRKAMHRDVAKIVEKDTIRRVPVRTGALKADIRSAGYKASGVVRAGRARVPYAGPIHYGWPTRPFGDWLPGAPSGGPIAANPFMTDAVESERRKVMDSFERDIAAILRKYD
ncbi:MAG: HK97 gp10 family phage protein [Gammaproteobacteria bacterium]|nr:HK97 gp10 family phage protein [Gammaproteobacteria bacterium]